MDLSFMILSFMILISWSITLWEKDQMRLEPFIYHWHHCLVQISATHISRLYEDGLLDSFDFISFQGCESHL